MRGRGNLARGVRIRRFLLFTAVVALGAVAHPPSAEAAELRAGAGRADITPQTGYYLGGWTRADRTSHGQHTRLWASALVLKSGNRKVALVAVDLFMVPGGLLKHAAERAGFSERNVLISASHTHSGPGGFANYRSYNFAAPSLQTVTDPFTFFNLIQPKPADRQLYTFLVRQIATAIRRAERDVAPAAAAWGSARISGLTLNRSIEAHLANHRIFLERRDERLPGRRNDRALLDPAGVDHTIDPHVSVLRVDKVVDSVELVGGCNNRRRHTRSPASTRQRCVVDSRTGGGRTRLRRRTRRIPIGAWSTFAAHGTVTKATFEYYNQDHHASALRVFESGVRRAGRVPRSQTVVNVFGNTDEGDVSAGLPVDDPKRSGPAASDRVGRVEAAAMLRAWSRAGQALSRRPGLDLRWTRVCFCGQNVNGGSVSNKQAVIGAPFLTGSEEERGPLCDVPCVPQEGTRRPLAAPDDPQGHKLGIPIGDVPEAVPLLAVRIGDGLVFNAPGEATAEAGRRMRMRVSSAVAGSGVRRVVLSGLANEYIQYFTTPEEYKRQHYEGGSTIYGTYSTPFLAGELSKLAGRLVRGEPAPKAYEFDSTNDVRPDGPPYGDGAPSGTILSQPATSHVRLGHPELRWQGGERGLDRPVDRPFVLVQRLARGGWRTSDTDLGLRFLWTVDEEDRGERRYRAFWEVPLHAALGIYRLRIAAKRYDLVSRPFRVRHTRELSIREVAAPPGRVAVVLDYPVAVRDRDITFRPRSASGGVVQFHVGSRTVTVRRERSQVFSVAAPPGVRVSVPGGAARDRYGNVAGRGAVLQG